jgi:hypothetical protein
MSTTIPVINPHLESLIRAARQVQEAVDRGDISAGPDRRSCGYQDGLDEAEARAVDALDALSDASTDALDYANEALTSPFLRHREVILGGYSTACQLRRLVAHLYNGAWKCDLPRLFGNADTKHTLIALELIESYSRRGERDPAFMAIGSDIAEQIRAEEAR